jgi:hypothetical protein
MRVCHACSNFHAEQNRVDLFFVHRVLGAHLVVLYLLDVFERHHQVCFVQRFPAVVQDVVLHHQLLGELLQQVLYQLFLAELPFLVYASPLQRLRLLEPHHRQWLQFFQEKYNLVEFQFLWMYLVD